MNTSFKAWIFCGLVLLLSIAIFTSCGNEASNGTVEEIKNTDTPLSTTAVNHTHIFGNWVVSKEASCLENGLEIQTCSCGDQETRIVQAKGHVAGEWIVETEEGIKIQSCTVCGEQLAQEKISITGSRGLSYRVNSDGVTCTITGLGTCSDKDIVISEKIDGYRVTAIGERAFAPKSSYSKSEFKSIKLPDSLLYIDNYAFMDCDNLDSIVIPNSVLRIGNNSFAFCDKLTSVSLPESIVNIGVRPFGDCPGIIFTSFDHAVYFGNEANPYFCLLYAANKDITSCEIHPNTKIIAEEAFMNCQSLTNIIIPDSIKTVGAGSFTNCTNLQNVKLGNGVTNIESKAFRDCSYLCDITLPNGLKVLGEEAFRETALTKISIPGSVTEISQQAFYRCEVLTDITIGNGVTSIGKEAFGCCGALTDIVLPEGIESIGNLAFTDCSNLTNITIPNSVTHIEARAFEDCPKLTGTLENNAVYLGNDTNPHLVLFNVLDESISSFTIHPNTKFIENTFSDCKYLESITIPNGVISIGGNAFSHCDSLTNVTIPDGVVYIGYNAFYSCGALTSITIPKSVTVINGYAFQNNNNLKTVYFKGTMDAWKSLGFSTVFSSSVTIICSDGTISE